MSQCREVVCECENASWSAERFLKMGGAWSADLRKGWRVERQNFQFLWERRNFSRLVDRFLKKEKKKDIRACGVRKIYVDMVESGAKK